MFGNVRSGYVRRSPATEARGLKLPRLTARSITNEETESISEANQPTSTPAVVAVAVIEIGGFGRRSAPTAVFDELLTTSSKGPERPAAPGKGTPTMFDVVRR